MTTSRSNFIAAPEVSAGPLQSIIGDTALNDHIVRVYFGRAGENFAEWVTGEGFTAYEIERFEVAFAQIEAVANVDFQVVSYADKADFRLVLDTNEMQLNELGYFYSPGASFASGVGVFNGNAFDRNGGGNLEPGGLGAATVVHELLHGLGLMHPHDDRGGSTVMRGVAAPFESFGLASMNQGIFTAMSYNTGYVSTGGTAPYSNFFGHQIGPMALDIAALQLIYGAVSHAAGANVYSLSDQTGPSHGWKAIWDTGGADRIEYTGSQNATLDLRAATLAYGTGGGGYVSAVSHLQGGFTIAHGTVIEQAYGGNGNDLIIGNSENNRLIGRGGTDTLRGGAGDDWMAGGSGRDIMSGGSGDDLLYGQMGNDLLVGGNGKDRLFGMDGNDRLYGGQGADQLESGAGSDLFVFRKVSDSGTYLNNSDTILDFKSGQDRIHLAALDGDARHAGNQSLNFIGRARFDGADSQGDVRVHTRSDGVVVVVDLNGDGAADMRIMINAVHNMTADDFIL